MNTTESGISMDFSDLQPENAESSIYRTLSGIFTLSRLSQSLKVLYSIFVMPLGILTVFNDLQFSNTESSISARLSIPIFSSSAIIFSVCFEIIQ